MDVFRLLDQLQIGIEVRIYRIFLNMREDIPLFDINEAEDADSGSFQFFLDFRNQFWGLSAICIGHHHCFRILFEGMKELNFIFYSEIALEIRCDEIVIFNFECACDVWVCFDCVHFLLKQRIFEDIFG